MLLGEPFSLWNLNNTILHIINIFKLIIYMYSVFVRFLAHNTQNQQNEIWSAFCGIKVEPHYVICKNYYMGLFYTKISRCCRFMAMYGIHISKFVICMLKGINLEPSSLVSMHVLSQMCIAIGLCLSGNDAFHFLQMWFWIYGSCHGTVAVLLPGFALNWEQNQVTRQPHIHDLTHINKLCIGCPFEIFVV